MRFLKNKIHLKPCPESDESDSELELEEKYSSSRYDGNLSTSCENFEFSAIPKQAIVLEKAEAKHDYSQVTSKNIIKNYGKALCSFACSSISESYLHTIIQKKGYQFFDLALFRKYMMSKKKDVQSIESLKRLLIVGVHDGPLVRTYKEVFRELSIIFLKFFSVNWIYGGRLLHRNAHLKFRFKMLRRVQNPQYFNSVYGSPK